MEEKSFNTSSPVFFVCEPGDLRVQLHKLIVQIG